jgi:hypothetical protein
MLNSWMASHITDFYPNSSRCLVDVMACYRKLGQGHISKNINKGFFLNTICKTYILKVYKTPKTILANLFAFN